MRLPRAVESALKTLEVIAPIARSGASAIRPSFPSKWAMKHGRDSLAAQIIHPQREVLHRWKTRADRNDGAGTVRLTRDLVLIEGHRPGDLDRVSGRTDHVAMPYDLARALIAAAKQAAYRGTPEIRLTEAGVDAGERDRREEVRGTHRL